MSDLAGIQVTFLDQTGAKSVKAKISPGVTVAKILPNIITKMMLPVTAPDGTPMSYSLDHKEGGKRLQETQTLPDAGVQEGDHLIVYPEIVAGAERTGIASIDRDLQALDRLQKRSDKATGLVGKLIALPAADGSAYYTIEAEKGKKVLLRHHALVDGWTDAILGGGGWFPTSQIAPIVRREEAWKATMEGAARKQKAERKSFAQQVTDAALADLGPDADVYALASWAWRASRRGSGDERIKKDGQTPWANDIASALVDGKKFTAIKTLKDPVRFIMLADKFEDPIVYRNAPPDSRDVLAAVDRAFFSALGTGATERLKVQRAESPYLDNNFLDILSPWGRKIGSVCYDAATGKILQVSIAFSVDEKGSLKARE